MPSIDPRIPSPPVHFLPRLDLLAKVRNQLLNGNNPVGITGRPSAVGIQGMGGIGKTVLAAALAIDDEIIRAFPGGVHWLSLGTEPTLIEGQRHLARRLGGADANFTDESGGFDIVSGLLAKHSEGCLIVLDDVWELDHYEKLFKIHPPHRVLLTARNAGILHQIGAVEQPVDCLDKASARALLADYAERRVDLLPTPAANDIINECGHLPLALAIAGSVLRGADDDLWTDVYQALRDADHENGLEADLPGYLHGRHVFASLRISVDRLKEDERERLLDCAIFPEDEAVPTALFKWLWAGLSPLHCANLLTRLVDRNLLRRQKRAGGDFISLHDLQRDYLRHRAQMHSADNLANRHRRMAAAARTACKGDWSTLADVGIY